MLKQQGQNSLLVVSIPYTEDRNVVDLEYTVVLRGRKAKFWFSHFLSKYIFEGSLVKEEIEVVNILAGRIFHELELGIQEELLPLETHSLKILISEINGKFIGFRKNLSLLKFCPFIKKNPHEYYGEKGKLEVYPLLKWRRREKKHHFQRYVGVGYKDKGAAKDVSYDGVPSWLTTAGNINNVLEKLSHKNEELIPVKEFNFSRKDVFKIKLKKSIQKKVEKYAFDVFFHQENSNVELWKPDLSYGDLGFKSSFDWDDLFEISTRINKTLYPLKVNGEICFVIASKGASQWGTFNNSVLH